MNQDLLNILSDNHKEIDNQLLMDYLSGKLSEKEKHEVEKMMAENDFLNDAVEGLENFSDRPGVKTSVEQLNRELRKSLRKKKPRRARRMADESHWTYIAIILILLLCFVGYFVIRRMMH